MMRVTYLGHSGFLLEMQDACFLFDYYKGEFPKFDPKKKLFVFVSHVHYDHYRKEVFSLRKTVPNIKYIISDDVNPGELADGDTVFVKPNEEISVDGAVIRTLRSTDEGVAFLIHYKEKTFYHAGDLNWWHWAEESEEYNTKMRRDYQREINKLQQEKIDVAFVPVDPRLGEQYCWGLDCFMKRTRTKYVFPMHFWENYGIFERLKIEKCTEEYLSCIVEIQKEGQIFELKEL